VGRPITDLASDLLYPEMAADAREVLRKLGFSEKPIQTRDGRWFTVRIMPYRTHDDRIDGVVITFADITVAKTLEAKLREKHAVLERHVAGEPARLQQAADKVTRHAAGRRGIQNGGAKKRGTRQIPNDLP
jgi:two-component system CheB/CheR fusion protein